MACVAAACGSTPRDDASAPRADVASLPPALASRSLEHGPGGRSAQLRQQSEAAGAYGEVGRLLMAAEYFEAAEPYLLHAQAQAPEDVRWPYYLGHVLHGQRRAGAARLPRFNARSSCSRTTRPRWSGWATCTWTRASRSWPSRCSRARCRAARPVAALFGLGRAALARRDFARAVDYFEQALAADPRASVAHYPLALAYRALGDAAKAEAHLRQRGGVEVGPPDPLMVELRGLLTGPVAEEARGRPRARRRRLPRCRRTLPHGAWSRRPTTPPFDTSWERRCRSRATRAARFEEFEEVLRRSPGFPQAHYSLGVLLASSGRSPQAIEHLAAAVKSQPDYVDARLRLAEVLRQRRRDGAVPGPVPGGARRSTRACRTRASARQRRWPRLAACARLATPSAKGRACTLATPGSPRRRRAWNQRSRAANPCRTLRATRSASASVTGST